MEWLNLLNEIFTVCIIPLLGILVKYLVEYLMLKKEQINATTDNTLKVKYTSMLLDTIKECVVATNQTYVDSLKNQNAFDEEAQKAAFETTYNNIMNILSEEAKEYLSQIYGDLDLYVKQSVEATINKRKGQSK